MSDTRTLPHRPSGALRDLILAGRNAAYTAANAALGALLITGPGGVTLDLTSTGLLLATLAALAAIGGAVKTLAGQELGLVEGSGLPAVAQRAGWQALQTLAAALAVQAAAGSLSIDGLEAAVLAAAAAGVALLRAGIGEIALSRVA